jgi:DNA polymerase-1
MVKKDRKLLVLLDSHAIIHRAYHALPDFASSKGVPTGALYGLSTMLMGILEKFKPNYIIACYDLPQPTYRHEAYEGYKAGRKKTDDNLIEQLKLSRSIFEAFNIPMYDTPGFEADDILGTIVEQVLKNEGYSNLDIIIASGDMDTLQLVVGKRVQVYTLKKGIKDTVIYDESAVKERYGFEPKYLPDYKGLRGDPSDNIIGIAGIGEKTGSTLISTFKTIEHLYEVLEKDSNKIKEAGVSDRVIELLDKGKEEAMFSKMLATIRRDAPIKFEVPVIEWKENLNIQKVETLFREYEFRTLGARLKQFTTGSVNGVVEKESTPITILNSVDKDTEKKLKVTLSVLNSNISEPTLEDVYAVTKTFDPKEAEETLLREIKDKKLDKVLFDIEWPLIPVLESMESIGIKIDVDFLKKLGREYHKKLSDLEKNIWKESGVEFNINSPKQLSEVLFEKLSLGGKNIKKTSTGVKSTKESELEKMKGTHPVIDLILEYRELAKLLSTYIDVLPTLVDENKRLHTRFLQMGAATGRMASKNPNLQNIPIRSDLGKAIRHAFVCEDGYTLVSFDYSQIELRIAAILSEDSKFIDIFKKGTDVHTGVAARVFNVPESEVTKTMRTQAKVINFGILYGMGVNALKTNLGSTRDEAQTFYEEYFKNFNELASYLEYTKKEVAKKGYTETLFGRRRYFEGINSKLPFIRAAAERMAINAPIQGTQADIIKISMRRIQDVLEKENLLPKAKLLLQIHDELIFEIRTPDVKPIAKIIKKIMESVLTLEQTKGVPIITSANAGKNWGELEALEF